jgi:hypothetical protein
MILTEGLLYSVFRWTWQRALSECWTFDWSDVQTATRTAGGCRPRRTGWQAASGSGRRPWRKDVDGTDERAIRRCVAPYLLSNIDMPLSYIPCTLLLYPKPSLGPRSPIESSGSVTSSGGALRRQLRLPDCATHGHPRSEERGGAYLPVAVFPLAIGLVRIQCAEWPSE